jgi:hypothetical protein
VDAFESISPPPPGSVELWEVRQAVGSEMSLISGIEPVRFLGLELLQFSDYVGNQIERVGSGRYILAKVTFARSASRRTDSCWSRRW